MHGLRVFNDVPDVLRASTVRCPDGAGDRILEQVLQVEVTAGNLVGQLAHGLADDALGEGVLHEGRAKAGGPSSEPPQREVLRELVDVKALGAVTFRHLERLGGEVLPGLLEGFLDCFLDDLLWQFPAEVAAQVAEGALDKALSQLLTELLNQLLEQHHDALTGKGDEPRDPTCRDAHRDKGHRKRDADAGDHGEQLEDHLELRSLDLQAALARLVSEPNGSLGQRWEDGLVSALELLPELFKTGAGVSLPAAGDGGDSVVDLVDRVGDGFREGDPDVGDLEHLVFVAFGPVGARGVLNSGDDLARHAL
ncbi:MAG: hypothetical protein ACRDT8_08485 [Micromonosporaceae bacterium]